MQRSWDYDDLPYPDLISCLCRFFAQVLSNNTIVQQLKMSMQEALPLGPIGVVEHKSKSWGILSVTNMDNLMPKLNTTVTVVSSSFASIRRANMYIANKLTSQEPENVSTGVQRGPTKQTRETLDADDNNFQQLDPRRRA